MQQGLSTQSYYLKFDVIKNPKAIPALKKK
jgi:hypothetical protein